MLSLAVNGYTSAQVLRVLQALDGRPQYLFRADLLDLDNVLLFPLDGLQQQGTITHDTQQPMKRGAELHFLITNRDDQHSASLGSFAETVALQGPIVWLRCDEASGNFADSSGNSRTFTANGTFNGVGSLTLGDPLNNAVTLNGTTAYMSRADEAAWDVTQLRLVVACRGTGTSDTLIDRDDGGSNRFWRLEINSSGNIALTINFTSGSITTYTGAGAINDGMEHLIDVSYDGANVEIYVDGKRLLKTAETRTMATGALGINVGRNNAAANFYAGTLDEVQIYNRAPTAKERRDMYQAWSAQITELLIDRDRGDRVKIYAGVTMPSAGTDGRSVAEWPQIVAVLTSPQEDYAETGSTLQITCQDQTRILQDAAFAVVTTVAAGANYITGTNGVLAIAAAAGFNTSAWAVTTTTLTAPADIPFEIGSTFLDAINYLLTAINYKPIRFSGSGAGIIEPNVLDADLPLSDTINSSETSVIGAERLSRRLEPRKVINQVNVANGNPDVTPIVEFWTNTSAHSPSSTVWNAPKIKKLQIDAANQATASAIALQQLTNETAKMAERIVLETLLRPYHDDRDRVHLNISEIRVNDDYVEETWSLPLDPTGLMNHVFLSIVDLT